MKLRDAQRWVSGGFDWHYIVSDDVFLVLLADVIRFNKIAFSRKNVISTISVSVILISFFEN